VSAASLRPGVARGSHPESALEARHWLARRQDDLVGRWRSHREAIRIRSVPGGVEKFGRGLRGISADDLETELSGCRRELLGTGLTPGNTLRAFALIREVSARVLGQAHYDVQLMGGWVMIQGMLAEMRTGEGKTLTATLPACAAALAGIPVHVVSCNDYLVARDADEMGPLYQALGLSVGTVTQEERDPEARRLAYGCDVTYVTSNQLAFDYLKDRVANPDESLLGDRIERLGSSDRVGRDRLLRGLCFAVVDEADSIMIDEATTPLILSRPSASAAQQRVYEQALELARGLEDGIDFRIDRTNSSVEICPRGEERLAQIAKSWGDVWKGERRRREWAQRGLSALHLYQRDRDYVVHEEKVEIIDPLTGRRVPDRSWQQGLHQLIELKEGVALTAENEILAKLSYQRFFRRYLRLAGMTGTATEVARELQSVYGLATVVVPTRKRVLRTVQPQRCFKSASQKWDYVVARVREAQRSGQPVLVGTDSVESSELLSDRLRDEGLKHQLLNARQDSHEAEIVAHAGQPAIVTVATSMAGRGTDIPLGAGVSQVGGLRVIATEGAASRRVDRQLMGRCGRQGDPGSFEMVISLEDERLARGLPLWLQVSCRWVAGRRTSLPTWLAKCLLLCVQHAEEMHGARVRRGLMFVEETREALMGFSGARE